MRPSILIRGNDIRALEITSDSGYRSIRLDQIAEVQVDHSGDAGEVYVRLVNEKEFQSIAYFDSYKTALKWGRYIGSSL